MAPRRTITRAQVCERHSSLRPLCLSQQSGGRLRRARDAEGKGRPGRCSFGLRLRCGIAVLFLTPNDYGPLDTLHPEHCWHLVASKLLLSHPRFTTRPGLRCSRGAGFAPNLCNLRAGRATHQMYVTFHVGLFDGVASTTPTAGIPRSPNEIT